MPCLSRMFRSKSRKAASNPHSLRIKAEPQPARPSSTRLTQQQQQQITNLRQNVAAAQAALSSLDALASTLDDETSAESVALSAHLVVSDMRRSTKALTTVLNKHAPPPPPPPPSTSTETHPAPTDLYPPRLRLPAAAARNKTPVSATELRTFAEWTQPSARRHTPIGGPKRPVSLPPPARPGQDLARGHPRTPSFSTEAKTRRLRALQTSGSLASSLGEAEATSLDKGPTTPLGMDELMAFLRGGNSMRDL